MVRVKLRSKRARLVEHDVIVHGDPTRFGLELPSGLINLSQRKLLPGVTCRFHINHVLGKIANLIKSVPHRQLNLMASALRIVGHGYMHTMMHWIGQQDGVIEF